jgi:HTH-type transcriptional regulator / antitoxin HipB
MIQNNQQYKVSEAKLKDLEKALTQIDSSKAYLHPRKILGRKNSLKVLIRELRQEIDEYQRKQ